MRHMQVRQGDVFLERVAPRAKSGTSITDQGRIILAYGEVTGHAHEVVCAEPGISDENFSPAQLFEEPDGTRYLFVERSCTLTHQEHGPIALAPGVYKVTRQREYSPEAIRSVAD